MLQRTTITKTRNRTRILLVGIGIMLWVGLVGSAMALVPDSPSDDFAVSSATYLGGSGADQATAVDVAPDWSVVFGGTMPSHNPDGVTPVELLGGGDGVVIRLSHDGSHVQSITRIGQQVNDLEINDEGAIAVCGDFGVALLSADAQSITWNDDSGSASRCAIAQGGADSANGTVAAIIDGNAHVYDAQGNALGTWEIGGSSQSDITVDAATQSVIATGYNQVSSDLQVAYLKAWSYDGATLKWTSYNFSASEVTGENLGADTRGERVAIGRDGKVYFAGTINGGTGASIFARDPKDITSSAGDRTVTTDNYNTPTNVGSIKMTWYGRYAPDTGDLELGQSLLTRLSSGKGNSIAPNALMADAQGRLYIGGSAYASIERRDERSIAGTAVGGYSGGEAFFLIVSSDFQERLIWTPFSGEGGAGGSPVQGVGVRGDVVAIAADVNLGKGATMITHNALQETTGGGDSETYLAVSSPAETPVQSPVLADIPGQTIEAGQQFETLSLDAYVSDSDHDDDQLTWQFQGIDKLSVVTDTQRIATITAPQGWTGSETITFVVSDPDGQSTSDDATFTVLAAGQLQQLFLPTIIK